MGYSSTIDEVLGSFSHCWIDGRLGREKADQRAFKHYESEKRIKPHNDQKVRDFILS